MVECESFFTVESVSISKEKETQRWFLRAKWVRHESEKDCLNNIMLRHGLSISEIDGYTVFREST
jgi:hypothetical protein